MGLDPGDDDYKRGILCVTCNDVVFAGKTPNFVWANVTGLENCPIYAGHPLPNGSFKLTQTANPCIWQQLLSFPNPHPPPADQIIRIWWNAAGGGHFTMNDDALPFWWFFRHHDAGNCVSSFDNDFDCTDLEAPASHNGHCDITWGPDQPCGE